MTIWFKPLGSSGALSVDVKNNNPDFLLDLARHIWDNLSENFEMVSSRP